MSLSIRFKRILISAACFVAFASAARAQSSQAVLRSGDVLRIRIWPDSSLGGDYAIEEDGTVILPVLGRVTIRETDITRLRGELRARYAEAGLRSPVITITPIFKVAVLGAVLRPGLYDVTPNLNLFDIIALAGGLRENARDDMLTLVRDARRISIDVTQPETLQRSDLELRSGDQIHVAARRNISAVSIFYVVQSALLLYSVLK
jgi:polysaccharide biosynthesis/export protein